MLNRILYIPSCGNVSRCHEAVRRTIHKRNVLDGLNSYYEGDS